MKLPLTRREMLSRSSMGFGALALAGLLADDGLADSPDKPAPFGPRQPHFPPRVKHVIFCYMSGGVSQVDSFDPKPRLTQEAGRPMPMPLERTQNNKNGAIFPSPWGFTRYGKSGIEVSDLFPRIGSCADDLCVIRSMTVKFTEHSQGNF